MTVICPTTAEYAIFSNSNVAMFPIVSPFQSTFENAARSTHHSNRLFGVYVSDTTKFSGKIPQCHMGMKAKNKYTYLMVSKTKHKDTLQKLSTLPSQAWLKPLHASLQEEIMTKQKSSRRGERQWFLCSVLNGRTQQMRVGNSLSAKTSLTSGVVQASVISPLLFMLFINDITLLFSVRKCACKLYADDLKLYTVLHTYTDYHNWQDSLNAVYDWTQMWQFNISHKKYNLMYVGNAQSKPSLNSIKWCWNRNCCLSQGSWHYCWFPS